MVNRVRLLRTRQAFCVNLPSSVCDIWEATTFLSPRLFTIGLWKLNPDGTDMLDQDGNRIPTYSNDQIMNFARVFTGFDEQRDRGNVEYVDGRNRIDPM